MANLKSFKQFLSEKNRSEEIEDKIVSKGVPETKENEAKLQIKEAVEEETEEETEEIPIVKETKLVSEMLKECYTAVKNEAAKWAEDAHDEHTVETYMIENTALVASLAANSLKEMNEEMETEAYESALNQMIESFTKKINECKESYQSPDAADVE